MAEAVVGTEVLGLDPVALSWAERANNFALRRSAMSAISNRSLYIILIIFKQDDFTQVHMKTLKTAQRISYDRWPTDYRLRHPPPDQLFSMNWILFAAFAHQRSTIRRNSRTSCIRPTLPCFQFLHFHHSSFLDPQVATGNYLPNKVYWAIRDILGWSRYFRPFR